MSKTECMKGALWLTVMGRIVLDNHGGETFCEPYDKKIMNKSELTSGIGVKEFMKRMTKCMMEHKK